MIISAASESFVSEDNDAVEKASAMEGWTEHSLPGQSHARIVQSASPPNPMHR